MPFDLGPISHPNSDDIWSDALAPIIRTFSFSQLETVLYAFLPTRIEQHVPKTGIYAVDTFVITASVTLILTVAKLTLLLLTTILTRLKHKRDMELANQGYLTIVVEPSVAQDDYHISKLPIGCCIISAKPFSVISIQCLSPSTFPSCLPRYPIQSNGFIHAETKL